ncbi:MAG: Zn-dependent alcohol dehydrogenase [Spongiibacteraceae bacterium]|nr:Zn-dependent alcohol dehydrogenase [Spongiibacteraceae bacterium]
MKAVVARAINNFSVEEISIDPPKAGEIKIKMKATGVCHSDLSVINGVLPSPMPIVVGHEGAGIVEEIGEGVTRFEVGDHVVLSFIPTCGECHDCHNFRPHLCSAQTTGMLLDGTSRTHDSKGEDLNVMQLLGCMAQYAVVPQISAVKIEKDIPFDKAALVGCAVMTGVGAVINTAKVEPGSSVAVFGCGGVGLSIIQGARLAGASKIIAVDLADNKLDMAKSFGATHVINSSNEDPVACIRELTGGGVDYAFEAAGVAKLMELTNEAVRRGGTAVIVGIGSLKETVSFNALLLSMTAKTIKGCLFGDANPPVDFPKLLELYKAGKLNLDDMVSKTYSIDDAVQAFDDMKENTNARGVIVY